MTRIWGEIMLIGVPLEMQALAEQGAYIGGLVEHVGERELEDVVGEAVGIFVLEPEAARMEEGTVVGAVGADEGRDDGDFVFFVGLLAAGDVEDFGGPACLHVFEEVEAVALVVGGEEVQFAVSVNVNEP